jgi:hypothetical protein
MLLKETLLLLLLLLLSYRQVLHQKSDDTTKALVTHIEQLVAAVDDTRLAEPDAWPERFIFDQNVSHESQKRNGTDLVLLLSQKSLLL